MLESSWQKRGKCHSCQGEREVSLYEGHYYCWMCLKEKKDRDATKSGNTEKGYKEFHKIMSRFKDA